MATIEELIYQTLTTSTEMASKLAAYNTAPAVFEKQAPEDSSRGWSGDQYPRISYLAVFQEDPERKVSGSVTFEIYTTLDDETGPEAIEAELKQLLDGTFFETDIGTLATRWQRADPWDQIDGQVTGLTVVFDMLAFPRQPLPDEIPEDLESDTDENPEADTDESPEDLKPDPIAGLISWTKTLLGDEGAFFVDGNPQAQPVWKPTATKPAIYWRFVREELQQLTNAVAWFNATCACHVIAPSPADRIPYIRRITENLAFTGVIQLPDNSPLLFWNISADSTSDMLSVGQINISGRYGILRPTPVAEYKLNKVRFR